MKPVSTKGIALVTVMCCLFAPRTVLPSSKDIYATGSLETVKEANDHFTFRGRPIAPACISELGDFVKAVDVANCSQSNVLFTVERHGPEVWLRYDEKQGQAQHSDVWFAYRNLGRTASGIHVVLTVESEGGSGEYETVLLLRFDVQSYIVAFTKTGDMIRESRLILNTVGVIPKGDRDDGQVVLDGNTLTLTRSRYRDNEEKYILN